MAAGRGAAWLSRRLGLGQGSIITGRVALLLYPGLLGRLAAGKTVVLVSGTNGKTTTSHLLAAALRSAGPTAHNLSGANMADGAVAALAAEPHARYVVLEVDELHLPRVAAAVDPAGIVLLSLTRDQLDRGAEVRTTAAKIRDVLARHPKAFVVTNADDPLTVWAAGRAARRPIWIGAGATWQGDAAICPQCGRTLDRGRGELWRCTGCRVRRPHPGWSYQASTAHGPCGRFALRLRLPGRFNAGNALMALAAAHALGVGVEKTLPAVSHLDEIGGRYAVVRHGQHTVRLLLAKNPAGWAETLTLLDRPRPLLVIVNAREADGRDTSWLWDVDFEALTARPVAAAGEHAADLGVRLSYAGLDHHTAPDPLAALALLPAGEVDVVANYTAFHQLRRRLRHDR
ncbi:DUF1727 domain-containing protein [Pseudonocardia sp. K10HN5]|uniref:Lipid II isoglutaminyl synthase (glutamine-hydrolyzing) subunit MurT n=1 Tax=Pseudonocardia acidicola TaxID=2724939 RepID=A0ABX1SLK4_9PSEU|nr:DUF1727 domain-containing protein [Pseudonocardia acidicola]